MIHPLTAELYADAQTTHEVIEGEFPDSVVILIVDGSVVYTCDRTRAVDVLWRAIEEVQGG